MGQTRSRRRDKKNKEKPQEQETDFNADFIPLEPLDTPNQPQDSGDALGPGASGTEHPSLSRDNRSSFFGLLDRAELDYFKNAESMLATNALTHDEQQAFIENVFVEAEGKELKLATNQVCSKLLERLTGLANEDQLHQLVRAFEPFVVDLAFQKFSSHCLEAIISKAVPVKSCEDLVESAARKLEAVAADLTYDQYASHVLTTTVLSLGGLNGSMRSKKSQLARKHVEIGHGDDLSLDVEPTVEVAAPLRSVAISIVRKFIETLDEVEARKLAVDPIASPVMQAMIVAEAALMSSYKLVERIVLAEDSKGLVSHCLSDSVGSHFLDTVVRVLPAKKANKFISQLPLAQLSVSENKASQYLVQSILSESRLSKQRKTEILRNEVKAALGKSVGISTVALDIDYETTAEQIISNLDLSLLDIRDNNKSALIERLANYAPFAEKAVDSIVAMDDDAVMKMGVDPTHSYVLQSLLNVSAPLIARRKLVNKLIPQIPVFVVNAFGSHIVDSLWSACYKLKFNRERIANELAKMAEQVKHSPYGRKVWKNWKMEKYIHKRHEWWQAAKAEEDKIREQVDPQDAKAKETKPDAKLPVKKRKVHA